nr:MAG TPA: hypothetical protein [Caudoviricetes sp.]
MSDRDKMIGELRIKLSNIEYAGHELSEVTNQHGDNLVYTETKIAAALLHINDAANSVRDLIAKIEREDVYKLKILDTDLYLIHINEHETTVTTNKKAAKAYDGAGVYDAKVLAEKQGFALRAEVIDVAD